MFTLTKWYLDVVGDDGTVAVVYSARLGWGGARVSYGSRLVSRPGEPAEERSTFSDAGQVHAGEGTGALTWSHAGLDAHGRWQGLAPPITQRLLETPQGDILWHCAAPCARVELDAGSKRISGLGYAEQLTLTLPPWRLPFRFLRWGRFVSAGDHVIWTAWRGQDERQFIWHEQELQPHAVLEAGGVRGLAGHRALHVGPPRDVCARPALSRIIDRLPSAVRRLAAPMEGMFEHKQVAPSRLVTPDGRAHPGWSLFEEVRW